MKNLLTHIFIQAPEPLLPELKEIIAEGTTGEKPNVIFRNKEEQIWAAYEWAVPGLISVYILKPYFETFLQEAAKDHYSYLKKALKKVLGLSKKMKVNKITSSKISEASGKRDTQSKAISIYVQTSSGSRIKLLFDEELDLETWQQSLDLILDMLKEQYKGDAKNEVTYYLDYISDKGDKIIYATIDPVTKNWKFTIDLSKNSSDMKEK